MAGAAVYSLTWFEIHGANSRCMPGCHSRTRCTLRGTARIGLVSPIPASGPLDRGADGQLASRPGGRGFCRWPGRWPRRLPGDRTHRHDLGDLAAEHGGVAGG